MRRQPDSLGAYRDRPRAVPAFARPPDELPRLRRTARDRPDRGGPGRAVRAPGLPRVHHPVPRRGNRWARRLGARAAGAAPGRPGDRLRGDGRPGRAIGDRAACITAGRGTVFRRAVHAGPPLPIRRVLRGDRGGDRPAPIDGVLPAQAGGGRVRIGQRSRRADATRPARCGDSRRPHHIAWSHPVACRCEACHARALAREVLRETEA
jgi:hypothetical protein